jgi:hypothetical protein
MLEMNYHQLKSKNNMFRFIEKIKQGPLKGLAYVVCLILGFQGFKYSLDGMSSYSDILVWTGFAGIWLSGYFTYKTIKSIINTINN